MRDLQLRQDVVDELEYEPSIDAAHIGVGVDKGVVTLTGHVASYAEKQAAIAAVRRIKGVRAIAEEIEVLDWDTMVPSGSIQVMVHDGWITLTGSVDWHYQRKQAEEDVRKLSGVRGVINTVEIKPSVQAEDVKRKIEEALKRYAAIDDNAIRVTVPERNKVVLEGKVSSWDERHAVETAAWSAPGVKSVEDRMIGPFVYDDNDDD